MKNTAPFVLGIFLLLLALHAPATVRYVDLNSPNATPPFTDWTTAATNIQDAVNAANFGDVVKVMDGIYNSGGRLTGDGTSNRVAVTQAILIQSVNGSGLTLIDGGHALRCVYLTNGAALMGFTLTNGNAGNGGGVASASTNSLIANCLLINNTASSGGGAYLGTLTNCMVSGNVCPPTGGNGGGATRSVLNNCTLIGNVTGKPYPNTTGSTWGGGANACTLNNCTLTGNKAYGAGATGGGANGCVLFGCLLANGYADQFGGGAYNCNATNCNISNNSAGYGGGGVSGGIYCNCLLTGNGYTGFGGAVYWTTTLNNCVVTGNLAGRGGGGYGCTFNNCIVYYNTYGGDNYSDSVNYCCTPDATGVGCFTNAPLFADGVYHLQAGSPCINAGKNTLAGTATDLDGNPRITGGTVDIGAYEFPSPSSVLSYAWAHQYGLLTDGSADFTDPDGDGLNNWQEWIAGTVPTNSLSVLKMFSPSNNVPGLNVSWQSVSGKTYFLQRSTNLLAQPAFSSIQSNLTGAATTTIYSDTTATNGGPYFYRVGVQ